MLQFDTDETIRDCAECGCAPILRKFKSWWDVYCETCEEACSAEYLDANKALKDWDEQMYEASGDLDKDVDRDGGY